MSRFFFLLREALVNLRRNLLVVAGAVLAVFISLTLAFGALVVNEILRVNTLAWQEGVHVIAFLNDEGTNGVPPGAHQALLAEVESWEEVKPASYVDKAQAWVEFQEIFAGQDELLEIDPDHPACLAPDRVGRHRLAPVGGVQARATTTGGAPSVTTAAESIEQLQNLSSVLNVLGIGHGHRARRSPPWC